MAEEELDEVLAEEESAEDELDEVLAEEESAEDESAEEESAEEESAEEEAEEETDEELKQVERQYSDAIDELLAEPADTPDLTRPLISSNRALPRAFGTMINAVVPWKYLGNKGDVDKQRKQKYINRDTEIQRQKAQVVKVNIKNLYNSLQLQQVSAAQTYMQATAFSTWAQQAANALLARSNFDTLSWDANSVQDLKDCLNSLQSIQDTITQYVRLVQKIREVNAAVAEQLFKPARKKLSPLKKAYEIPTAYKDGPKRHKGGRTSLTKADIERKRYLRHQMYENIAGRRTQCNHQLQDFKDLPSPAHYSDCKHAQDPITLEEWTPHNYKSSILALDGYCYDRESLGKMRLIERECRSPITRQNLIVPHYYLTSMGYRLLDDYQSIVDELYQDYQDQAEFPNYVTRASVALVGSLPHPENFSLAEYQAAIQATDWSSKLDHLVASHSHLRGNAGRYAKRVVVSPRNGDELKRQVMAESTRFVEDNNVTILRR